MRQTCETSREPSGVDSPCPDGSSASAQACRKPLFERLARPDDIVHDADDLAGKG